MNIREPYLVLSAEREGLGEEVNLNRTSMLKTQLQFRKIDFKEIFWNKLHAYLCYVNDGTYAFDCLLGLARRYGQTKVIYSDANGRSTVFLLNPRGPPGVHVLHGEPITRQELNECLRKL